MDLEFSQRQELRQAPRIVPEQIFAGRLLQMPAMELEAFLRAEFQENAALLMEETEPEPETLSLLDDEWEPSILNERDEEDPFRAVAQLPTLQADLSSQFRTLFPATDWAIGLDIIESLEADGYFREDALDAADRHALSVPEFEEYLVKVQALEPAGVAARDLRECLLIQWRRHPNAPPLTAGLLSEEAWNHFVSRDVERLANLSGADPAAVREALEWVPAHLKPYPAEDYRPEFESLAPRTRPREKPDVLLHAADGDIRIECPGLTNIRLGVDSWYSALYGRIPRTRGVALAPGARHVVEQVDRARLITHAVELRGQTLYRIADNVARYQRDLILRGPRFARPFTQKEVARAIGVHESTVCRATQGKLVRLPEGETVTFDYFFDGALPARELVADIIGREDPARPLNDGQIADELARHGIKIARRTVAKYRTQLHILPRELRRKTPTAPESPTAAL
jgi:RNA polymerase sigma-54 factor